MHDAYRQSIVYMNSFKLEVINKLNNIAEDNPHITEQENDKR